MSRNILKTSINTLKRSEKIDEIIATFKLLSTLDNHTPTYDILYKYLGHVKDGKIVSLCHYFLFVIVDIAGIIMTPEMIVFILVSDEKYELATSCMAFCHKDILKLNVSLLNQHTYFRLQSNNTESYHKTIRLSLWLLQHDLITMGDLDPYLQELFDIWNKELLNIQ